MLVDLVAIQFGILLLVAVLTPLSALQPDPFNYFVQGGRVLSGQVPYRDFPMEYPALALLPMVLPHVWPGTMAMDQYEWTFLFQNAVFSSAIAVSVAWLASRGWASGSPQRVLVTYAMLVLAVGPILAWRYDVFAALLSILAVVATARGRPAVAGVALGLGFTAKVYPAVLLPILALRYLVGSEYRPALRLISGFALAIGLVLLPVALLAGSGVFSFVDYQQTRGLQIESVLSGLVLLGHVVTGGAVNVYFGFGSFQISSPLADAFLARQPLLMGSLFAMLIAACFVSFRREHRTHGGVRLETLISYLTAAILLAIATNKVFSPQYVVWILPFAALLPRRQALVVAAICAITVFIYPLNYTPLVKLDPGMIAILNVRNLLVVALLVWLVDRRQI